MAARAVPAAQRQALRKARLKWCNRMGSPTTWGSTLLRSWTNFSRGFCSQISWEGKTRMRKSSWGLTKRLLTGGGRSRRLGGVEFRFSRRRPHMSWRSPKKRFSKAPSRAAVWGWPWGSRRGMIWLRRELASRIWVLVAESSVFSRFSWAWDSLKLMRPRTAANSWGEVGLPGAAGNFIWENRGFSSWSSWRLASTSLGRKDRADSTWETVGSFFKAWILASRSPRELTVMAP